MKLTVKPNLVVVALVLSCFAATAQAQTAARILIGYPAGSSMDVIARIIADKLAETLGRPVVVENRSGASGSIAAMALKASAPDGNTLMVAPDTVLTLNPHTIKAVAYDTFNDFVPVAHLGSMDYGLTVNASVPARNITEWINWVKANDKNAAYGSAGTGGGAHLVGWMVARATGVTLLHVPYRGVAPALADLVGGQIPAVTVAIPSILPLAKAGKVRLLATGGSRRSSAAPDVPTFRELGYPALEVTAWFGLYAPAGTRPEVVARYNELVLQAMRTPASRDRMRSLDLDIHEMAPAEIATHLKTEYERWRRIVKASGYSTD